MNLVKIAEDLKGVPLQALQSYVNGQNPEVPPYIAAGELQRRQAAMQRSQMAQGAAQAGAPSVKEQLEQATGLMSLQQQRQQQAIQQVAQQGQSQPMPTTEGTPQPVGMASGGIARIPVRDEMFEYAGGGIIGYQGGGQTFYQQAYRQGEEKGSIYSPDFGKPKAARIAGQRDRSVEDLQAELQTLQAARDRYVRSKSDTSGIDQAIAHIERKIEDVLTSADMGMENQRIKGSMLAGITDQPPAVPTKQPSVPQVNPDEMVAENRRLATSGIAGITDRPPAAPSPTPGMLSGDTSTEEVEAPAAPQQPSLQQEAAGILGQYMRKTPTQYTPEMAGEEEGKISTQSGIAGLEAKRQQMRDEYEKTKQSRGLDTMIAGLAGAARGYGGVAAGYLGAKKSQEAQDRKFLEDMYALDKAPAEKRYGTQSTLLREGKTDFGQQEGRQVEAATALMGTGQKDRSTYEERLATEVRSLLSEGKTAEANALIEMYRSIKFAGNQEFGPDKIRELATKAALKARENGEIENDGVQPMIEDLVKAASPNTVTQGPAGTQATASTMPTSPKALADQLKKQLGR